MKIALEKLKNPKIVNFYVLLNICIEYFGETRITGGHHIFHMPWPGNPRINLQKDGKMAKDYQVNDVRKAIEKYKEGNYHGH